MTQDVIVEQLDGEALGPDTAPGVRPNRPRRGDRRRRRRLIALGAAGAAGLAWLGWASPLTLVEHVQVSAPRGISAEAVRLASGISAQDHVPAVDSEKVRLAIMTALPAVAGVQVSRSLPDTITLEVIAREPFAVVDAGKGYYVMDSEGIVFDKVGSAKKLPLIKATTDVGREEARGVLLSMPEDLRKRVKQISAKTRDDVTLTLRGGATVRWGNVSDADLKARVLAGLLVVKADRYDVSAPLQPTTSGGAAAEPGAPTG